MPPEPPPEGVLIESARRDAGISVREAARRAGISEGWWRQVVKGYQNLSGGAFGVVRGVPAETVAKMAEAAGVAPDRMAADGQRPDAARIMRAAAPLPVAVNSAREAGVDPDDLNDPWTSSVREQVRAAREMHGPGATGSQIFYGTPASSYEAGLWDDRSLNEASRILSIAIIRAYRARDVAGSQNHGRSGRAGLALLVTLARR